MEKGHSRISSDDPRLDIVAYNRHSLSAQHLKVLQGWKIFEPQKPQ